MRRILLLGSILGWAFLQACSSSSPASSATSDAATDAPTSEDAGSDAEVGGDAGRFRSFFMVERWKRADPYANNTMAAIVTFHRDAPLPAYTQLDEHCGYHESDWGGPAPRWGTVKMKAPTIGEVTFPPGAGYDSPAGVLEWDTGDAIEVSASGDELPAFALSGTVPAPATLTTWDLPNTEAGTILIPRTEPLALTWTPASTEVFALLLQFDDAAFKLRGLLCFFPGTPGNATIPTSALAHLMSSSDVKNTNFYFSGASRQHVALDRVDLDLVIWNGNATRLHVQ